MFNIIITGLVSLLTDISTEMVYPLIPLYLATLGAQPTTLGLIEGFAESSASLLKLFSGSISDRFRRRKPIVVLGYAGSTIGKFLLYISHSWHLVFVGRMIDRVGKGIRTAPRDALIADCSPCDAKGKAFGIHRALDTLGAAIGVIIAIAIVQNMGQNFTPAGYRQIFLISLTPAVLGIILLLQIKEVGKSPKREAQTLPSLSFRHLPSKLRNLLIITGLFALGNSSNQFLIFRMQRSGLTTINILLLYLVYNLSYAILSYPAGRLADRIGKKWLLMAGYFVYGLVYWGFALIEQSNQLLAHSYLLFASYGAYSALTEGLEKALIAETAAENQRASLIGLHATITGIGLFPASLIAGVLWSFWGPAAPFWVGGTLGITAALALSILL